MLMSISISFANYQFVEKGWGLLFFWGGISFSLGSVGKEERKKNTHVGLNPWGQKKKQRPFLGLVICSRCVIWVRLMSCELNAEANLGVCVCVCVCVCVWRLKAQNMEWVWRAPQPPLDLSRMYLFLTSWIKCQHSIGVRKGRDRVGRKRTGTGPLACFQYSCAFLIARPLPPGKVFFARDEWQRIL